MANDKPPPTSDQVLQIFEETTPGQWDYAGYDLSIIEKKESTNFAVFASPDFQRLSEYQLYKDLFPEDFWPVLQEDINGSFFCDYSIIDGRVLPTQSWACFKIKLVEKATEYKWKQPSIFVDWDPRAKRQLVLLSDFIKPPEDRLQQPDKQQQFLQKLPKQADRILNPFFWHTAFIRVILVQYDQAFWLLRDLVRDLEKKRSQKKSPPPDFPLLHDIARHVFHYLETMEVAEHTLQRLVGEQARWRKEDEGNGDFKNNLELWLKTHRLSLFQEKGIYSLKTRAQSLNDRHLNEINLAFNLVSQRFGRNAQSDSAMMKTIGVVSMVYLPGTFVSGVFGTNFYSFNPPSENDWVSSPKVWVYWAVTIPLTLITFLVWALWHWRMNLMKWLEKARNRPITSSSSSLSPSSLPLTIGSGDKEKIGASFPTAIRSRTISMKHLSRKETV